MKKTIQQQTLDSFLIEGIDVEQAKDEFESVQSVYSEWVNDLTLDRLTDRSALQDLHGAIEWSYAGQIRTLETNIGVEPYKIRTELPETMDTIRFWIESGSMSAYEVAMRAHQSLVRIHPFPDGNGRATRLFADLVMVYLTQDEMIDWSNGHRDKQGYIKALNKADQSAGDVTDLMGHFQVKKTKADPATWTG